MKKLRNVLLVFFVVMTAIFIYLQLTDAMDADTEAPVIQADQDVIEVSVEATDEELLQGITATDNRDGDVTDSVMVVSTSKFVDTGVVHVKYAAFDSHNNVGTFTRKVHYTDYRSPEFSMDAPLVFRSSVEYPDYLEHIQAWDVLDGDITNMIRKSTGSKSEAEDGSSTVQLDLEVTNTAGDSSSLSLVATLLDGRHYSMDAPALSQYLVYTDIGNRINPSDYLTGVRSGLHLYEFEETQYTSSDVRIGNRGVDYNTPGVYPITFTLQEPVEETAVEEEPDDNVYRDPAQEEEEVVEVAPEQLGSTTLFVVVRG